MFFSPQKLESYVPDYETVGKVIVGGFILLVLLPALTRLFGLILSPETTTVDLVEFLTSFVSPWWADFAIAFPLLFVVFLYIISQAGVEDIL